MSRVDRRLHAPLPHDPDLAHVMRHELKLALQRLLAGQLPLACPSAHGGLVSHAAGHFHLAPELFVQLSGWTEFSFPQGRLRLNAGEALLLPPQLQHAESVGDGVEGVFRNIVLYAESGTLSCHLAQEIDPGRPGILHLESRTSPQAMRLQAWLLDACSPAESAAAAIHWPGQADARHWRGTQERALVAAAMAGVLQMLDSQEPDARTESPLVAKVRVWVQNQMGDQRLSVRGLAQDAGCTADHLSHTFHRQTGEHLVRFITRLRMERAARLLAERDMAVKEVAWACGYASPSYFIRSFREHFGRTPSSWRGPPSAVDGPPAH